MNLRDYFRRIKCSVKQAQEAWRNTRFESSPGDHFDATNFGEDVKGASILEHYAPAARSMPGRQDLDFDPEKYTKEAERFDPETSITPNWFMRKVAAGEARVHTAYLFEAKFNGGGKVLKESKKPFRIVPVFGHERFMQKFDQTGAALRKLRESRRMPMKEDFNTGLPYGWGQEQTYGPYDPNQYTEYAPLLGGYFYAQMYLSDMLKQMAYAFEAWNHNPIGHRAINALAEYTLGRRFDWKVNKKAKDFDKKEKLWEDFAKGVNLRQRLSKYWVREGHIFGEQMINLQNYQSIHPATVWEIVTQPTDISNVYYYYRSYPTQWQMFTGFDVKGAPGSKDVRPQDYIIEQIPYSQVLHTKKNCTSFEKRGRSTLFSTLGWLKRIKDLYNAQVTREQMLADYAWDVKIKGGAGDVSAFISAYSSIPNGSGNQFVHNEAVERTVVSAAQGATGRGGGSTAGDAILAFIATALGFPKDFFNVIAMGGGSRATALVAAEPFTKVIEDGQSDIEYLLHRLFEHVCEKNGLDYDDEDVEFTFPSITKDTTSEAVANIQTGLQEGFISRETAGTLYSQEMGISTYDYNEQQQQLKNEQARGDILGPMPAPAGRNGAGGKPEDEGPENAIGGQGGSDIHGDGKQDLEDNITNL